MELYAVMYLRSLWRMAMNPAGTTLKITRYAMWEPETGGFRHQVDGDAKAAMGPIFIIACGEHRYRGGRGGMAVRRPEVEREERTKSGEARCECEQESPHLECHPGSLTSASLVMSQLWIPPSQMRRSSRASRFRGRASA